MKTNASPSIFIVAGALAALPLASLASDHGHNHGHAAHKPASAPTGVEAVIKKVDKGAGKVTLSHGPLPNGMPAMTMTMAVKDAKLLNQVKAGDKVVFSAEDNAGSILIVKLDPVK